MQKSKIIMGYTLNLFYTSSRAAKRRGDPELWIASSPLASRNDGLRKGLLGEEEETPFSPLGSTHWVTGWDEERMLLAKVSSTYSQSDAQGDGPIISSI